MFHGTRRNIVLAAGLASARPARLSCGSVSTRGRLLAVVTADSPSGAPLSFSWDNLVEVRERQLKVPAY